MVAPNFKRASDTDTGSPSTYGAPDIVKIVDVLQGTHATERVQMDVIEGREKNSPPFLFLVRQLATNSFQTIRGTGHPSGNPGTIDFTGSEFRNVLNSTISSLPDDATDASKSQGVIYIQGANLNCATGTINVNRAVTIDGLGTAVIQKTGTYTDINTALIQCARSNITLRNMTVEDTDLTHGGANGNTDNNAAVVGINCQPPSQHATLKNLRIENVFLKNIYYHAIDFAAVSGRIIDHPVIYNCTADCSASSTPSGACFVIGSGVRDALIDNNKIIEPGHTGIDIWGPQEHIRCTNNYIYKNAKTAGCGIAVVRFADHIANEGLAEDVLIMGNRVFGALSEDGIKVWGEARKVVVSSNFIDGSSANGISVLPDNIEGTDKFARETVISNNVVRNVGEQGIKINVDPAITTPHGIVVTANLLMNIGRHGIDFNSGIRWGVINSNVVSRYGTSGTSGTYAGVHLRICNNCTVNGNTLFGNSTNSINGVLEETTSDRNIITSNNCNKAISTIGTNTVQGNNVIVAA